MLTCLLALLQLTSHPMLLSPLICICFGSSSNLNGLHLYRCLYTKCCFSSAIIEQTELYVCDVIAISSVYYSRDIGVKSLALFLLSSNLLVRLRP